MTKAKLVLDDEGFETLGNALLLGYSIRMMQRRNGPLRDEDGSVDRVEYSARSELRDALERAGGYDRRLAGGIDVNANSLLEGVPEVFQRWADLANSDADIANLRLREIDFVSYLPVGSELLRALEDADGYELRTPLAKLGPTKLTFRIMKMVLDYYSGDMEKLNAGDVAIANQATYMPQTRLSRRGFAVEDRPFIELAFHALKSGSAKNPNEAIRMIEDGLWKDVAPQAGSFDAAVAGGGSSLSKRTRLYKQVVASLKKS